MKRTVAFWIVAFIVTIASAIFQRMTGPTYPKSGDINFEGKSIHYKFERSHVSSSNYVLEIETGDPEIKGVIKWRYFKTLDEFNVVEMEGDKKLKGEIPAQAPLKKLEYFVELRKNSNTVMVPNNSTMVIRFKGDVPNYILFPHVLAMFLAMMFSFRTGLEGFTKEPKYEKLTLWTIIILFIGGFPLGFAMNYFAFGQMWTGFPIGNDITDNKTLIAFIGWLVAFWMVKKNQLPKLFAILAALLMMLVYMIPHSV